MTLPLLGVIGIGKVQAQITKANDSTDTVVTPAADNADSNQIDITGGKPSGTNLFHSLEKFNVNKDQTANFKVAPENANITNILTRVTGGDVSKINGTIKVTGGNNPNLFLMNPAGFIFGNGAKLVDFTGSLTVTTANGIGFGSDSNINFFSATGDNTYTDLTGNPTAFAFTMDNPGGIVNSGDLLKVEEGQNLTLVGGTVVNTGTLDAKGGQITIAAVPGKSTVRISQQGNLLSLDIASTTGTTGNPNPLPNEFTIKSLPDLLTGDDSSSATEIKKDNDNGSVLLTGSGISIKNGDVVSYNSGENSLASVDHNQKFGSPLVPLNVSIISKNGSIKTDGIQAGEKVLLSAEKGNIEVDTIFAGIVDNGNFDRDQFRAGDINIKAGGFFRAIETEPETQDNGTSNGSGTSFPASITVANPASLNNADSKAFISIKTKNQADTENEPEPQIGDERGRVKIEVGSEFFVVGNDTQETGSFKDNESGTIGVIAARTNGNQSGLKSIDGRTFGSRDQNPEPPDQEPNPVDQQQNQEESETTFFGVLSLDESLIALLEDKGHATELTLSNDSEGELKGSDFNFFKIDDEEELETFNFDRGSSYKNYVFHRE